LRRLTLVLAFAGLACAAGPASGGAPACDPLRAPEHFVAVTAEGDLSLSSLGAARLAGIRLPDEPALRDRAVAWLRARAGRPAWAVPAHARDRWGRRPVLLRVAEGAGCLDLAEGLVAEGLALLDAGIEGIALPSLRAVEVTARKQNLGLWAQARYKALSVEPAERLHEWVGRFVLVEGRVRSIGERRAQTYLNFGSDWTSDFTIIIPKRAWTGMAARGIDAATLKGRRVRARGILEGWQGAALRIAVPEMIEVLDEKRQRR
jgi:hypothetical protein